MRPLTTVIRPTVFAVTLLFVCLPLRAQTNTGRILGTVTDSTGAALNGATLAITDVERGVIRALTTDEAGAYVAPNLVPGTYKVRAEAKGFRTVERVNILLEVAKDVVVDFRLQPGEVRETIIVTEDVPLLDTTSATLGGTLSNNEINDLPLNGRNYENLLQLRPGVTRYPGGGFSTTSTNGLRAEDNAYTIEGLFNSEPYSGQGIINGAGIAGDSATILPIDAIQEFNIQENPPAEYGWKPGAVVNVALKSGTTRCTARPSGLAAMGRWMHATTSTQRRTRKPHGPWNSSEVALAVPLSKTRSSFSAHTRGNATTSGTRSGA